MNGTVSSFPPESPAPRRPSRRLILAAVAVVLLIAAVTGLFRWQQEQSERAQLAARLSAVRQEALRTIEADRDFYGVCSGDNGTDIPCQAWFVDASVTKNGTITIVSVAGSPDRQVTNDGVITEEPLTGTLNISHMVILQEELSAQSDGT